VLLISLDLHRAQRLNDSLNGYSLWVSNGYNTRLSELIYLCLLSLKSLRKFLDKRQEISSLHVWSEDFGNDEALRNLVIADELYAC
jgi:hypothetical protein